MTVPNPLPHHPAGRRLGAGSAATPADLRTAEDRDRLLRTELSRVRESATAWRNGLGALLVGILGFGLIQGRSDIRELAAGWAAGVGVLLLAALVVGGIGAWLLLRAAHGTPTAADAAGLPPDRARDHTEALSSVAALRRGIFATSTCALLLVAAVGLTWYGPPRGNPLQVTTTTGIFCGDVIRLGDATLTLNTFDGEVAVDLSTAFTIAAIDECP